MTTNKIEYYNEPAFPCPVGHIECNHPKGITKLEYFTGLAMQGLVASNSEVISGANALAIAKDSLTALEKARHEEAMERASRIEYGTGGKP